MPEISSCCGVRRFRSSSSGPYGVSGSESVSASDSVSLSSSKIGAAGLFRDPRGQRVLICLKSLCF